MSLPAKEVMSLKQEKQLILSAAPVNEQQCGNTCARVAKLPWLSSYVSGLSKNKAPYLSPLRGGAIKNESRNRKVSKQSN